MGKRLVREIIEREYECDDTGDADAPRLIREIIERQYEGGEGDETEPATDAHPRPGCAGPS